jgi:protoporphyrinogen oxidase
MDDVMVLEADQKPGGLCRTDHVDGFHFDRTGHWLHCKAPNIHAWMEGLKGIEWTTVRRRSGIFSHNVYTDYPFQYNLYGLPGPVIRECLAGFIRTRQTGKTHPAKTFTTFGAWILETLGTGIARHFMVPYNTKLWTVPPGEMTTEWMGDYVPRPSLADVVSGAFGKKDRDIGYNARFHYPVRGGIGTLIRSISMGLGNIRCGERVIRIDADKKRVLAGSGQSYTYEVLVNTAPLIMFKSFLTDIPSAIGHCFNRLQWASTYNINLGIRKIDHPDLHWVYIPGKSHPMYRVGFPSKAVPSLSPPETDSLYIEVSYVPGRRPDISDLYTRCIASLKKMGVIRSQKDILVRRDFDIHFSYVIYDRHHRSSRRAILNHLNARDILSIGRYGHWEYSDMESAVQQGFQTASKIMQTHTKRYLRNCAVA